MKTRNQVRKDVSKTALQKQARKGSVTGDRGKDSNPCAKEGNPPEMTPLAAIVLNAALERCFAASGHEFIDNVVTLRMLGPRVLGRGAAALARLDDAFAKLKALCRPPEKAKVGKATPREEMVFALWYQFIDRRLRWPAGRDPRKFMPAEMGAIAELIMHEPGLRREAEALRELDQAWLAFEQWTEEVRRRADVDTLPKRAADEASPQKAGPNPNLNLEAAIYFRDAIRRIRETVDYDEEKAALAGLFQLVKGHPGFEIEAEMLEVADTGDLASLIEKRSPAIRWANTV